MHCYSYCYCCCTWCIQTFLTLSSSSTCITFLTSGTILCWMGINYYRVCHLFFCIIHKSRSTQRASDWKKKIVYYYTQKQEELSSTAVGVITFIVNKKIKRHRCCTHKTTRLVSGSLFVYCMRAGPRVRGSPRKAGAGFACTHARTHAHLLLPDLSQLITPQLPEAQRPLTRQQQ